MCQPACLEAYYWWCQQVHLEACAAVPVNINGGPIAVLASSDEGPPTMSPILGGRITGTSQLLCSFRPLIQVTTSIQLLPPSCALQILVEEQTSDGPL